MGSWHRYIIESEEPQKAAKEIETRSNIDSNQFITLEGRIAILTGKIPIKDGEWNKLSSSIARVMYVFGNDTSDVVTADLYEIDSGSLKKIDSEASAYLPSINKENFSHLEDPETLFHGSTYLKGYFYRKHNFKMFDGREVEDVDYSKTYDPTDHKSVEHVCPACGRNGVKVDGWDAKCDNCGYTNSKPWFEGHSKFEQIASSPERKN